MYGQLMGPAIQPSPDQDLSKTACDCGHSEGSCGFHSSWISPQPDYPLYGAVQQGSATRRGPDLCLGHALPEVTGYSKVGSLDPGSAGSVGWPWTPQQGLRLAARSCAMLATSGV
eukprot:352480-Chlamydomonas_euryale.AAC.4